MSNTTWPTVPTSNAGFNYPRAGLNQVGEYMASGLPWVTQSVLSTTPSSFSFPYVTNEITIKNDGAEVIHFGFTENGVKLGNRFSLADPEQVTLRVRIDKIYFVAATGAPVVNIFAGLTQIDEKNFPLLTGSLAHPVTGKAAFLTGSTAFEYGYDGLG